MSVALCAIRAMHEQGATQAAGVSGMHAQRGASRLGLRVCTDAAQLHRTGASHHIWSRNGMVVRLWKEAVQRAGP
jgi:hypothetical protein